MSIAGEVMEEAMVCAYKRGGSFFSSPPSPAPFSFSIILPIRTQLLTYFGWTCTIEEQYELSFFLSIAAI